jgi:actin related protein 2/3 complex subunit 5
MDVNFRKIDIDQFDEDVLQESELYVADPRDPYEVLEEAKQRQAAVRTSLARCVSLFAGIR